MTSLTRTIRNFYRDSVALMQLSSTLGKLPGVRQASAIMASETNLGLLREAGLLAGAVDAGPNDLLIALEGDDEAALAAAAAEAKETLERKPPATPGHGPRSEPPRSLEMGLEATPTANFALISCPGAYAAAEAMKALRLGLHVMLFSDNVAVEDEIALKRYARAHDLMVMGPDCGTAIIGGIPLGFANLVRRGDIGVVAASGTGLQQVTCLIDRLGCGISQAIGTGGHDLSRDVGGVTFLQGLKALADDGNTRVIVLISKPPAPEVAAAVIEVARKAGKPVVVNFLGAEPQSVTGPNLTPARTLEDAALAAAALSRGEARDRLALASPAFEPPPLAAGQSYIRGLYSGGTFCYEASLLLGESLKEVFSNTPVGRAKALDDVWKSRGHTLIDLGDDVFTRGRPHPMIDHRLRNERIAKEARDPQTAAILLDVVIGHGAHADPASEIAPVVRKAIAEASASGRRLTVVGFVCGTPADLQSLDAQEAKLREAGVVLGQSNAQAVRIAARIAKGALDESPQSARSGGRSR